MTISPEELEGSEAACFGGRRGWELIVDAASSEPSFLVTTWSRALKGFKKVQSWQKER
jgi:hypothetical protein